MAKKKEQQDIDKELETAETGEQPEAAAEPEVSVEDQLRAENKAFQEQYLRTLADMENLRKRTQREKEDLAKFANENILREILPVIDNLERAVEHAQQTENSNGLLEGVQMTLLQFSQVLDRFGVEAIDAMGQPFDSAVHQAMGQLESADHPSNTVIQQMQKGYLLNKRLLRPAMVMISKAPAEPAAAESGDSESTSAADE